MHARLMYFLATAVVLLSCSCVHMWQDKKTATVPPLQLEMMVSPQNTGPCLASLVGPPSFSEQCIPWNDTIDAAPTYEPSRRLIFVGAGDNYLHVLDADDGHRFAQIPSQGRVITRTLIDKDSRILYFGTDKGVISAHDAYSFHKLFSVQADSKINDDIRLIENRLWFSTGLATVYALDAKNGKEYWRVARPQASDRLKLSSNSTIIAVGQDIVVPHPDGYISVLEPVSKKIAQISLTPVVGNRSFPDIVAPMVLMGTTLWVASFSSGLFSIDCKSWQVKEKIDSIGIHQLVGHEGTIVAATEDSLFAIKSGGMIAWQNKFSKLRARQMQQASLFVSKNELSRRVFLGLVSRLLIRDNAVIMATSLGAMGMFDIRNGTMLQVVGNGLGFGPKISFGGTKVFAVTRKGSLVRL